jgi:hypothetical protein
MALPILPILLLGGGALLARNRSTRELQAEGVTPIKDLPCVTLVATFQGFTQAIASMNADLDQGRSFAMAAMWNHGFFNECITRPIPDAHELCKDVSVYLVDYASLSRQLQDSKVSRIDDMMDSIIAKTPAWKRPYVESIRNKIVEVINRQLENLDGLVRDMETSSGYALFGLDVISPSLMTSIAGKTVFDSAKVHASGSLTPVPIQDSLMKVLANMVGGKVLRTDIPIFVFTDPSASADEFDLDLYRTIKFLRQQSTNLEVLERIETLWYEEQNP